MSLACIAHFSCFRKCVDNVSRSFKVAPYRKKTVLRSGNGATTKLIPLRLPRVLRKSENGLWTITWISTSPFLKSIEESRHRQPLSLPASIASSIFACVDHFEEKGSGRYGSLWQGQDGSDLFAVLVSVAEKVDTEEHDGDGPFFESSESTAFLSLRECLIAKR